MRLGYRLPGPRSIPLQISEDRSPYFDALDAADKAAARGEQDVSKMEQLMEELLAEQLYSVLEDARGSQDS